MLTLSTLINPASASGSTLGSVPIVDPISSTTDPAYVTFKKATYSRGTHGGPTPTYPQSVTMPASVALSGTPARVPDHSLAEPRPLTRMLFKITTAEDPADYLGGPLATDDVADWAGKMISLIGTAFPVSGQFEVLGELIS